MVQIELLYIRKNIMNNTEIIFSWQLLPNEIWIEIFQYLNTRNMCACRLTCSEWHTIVAIDRKKLDLSHYFNINNDIFDYLIRSCPKINYLALKKCPNLDGNLLELSLAKSNGRLTEIIMENCPKISIKHLHDIIVKNKYQMKILKLKNIGKGNNKYLPQIFTLVPQLLEFAFCNNKLFDKNLEDLSKYCTNLRSVTLTNCFLLTDIGLEHLLKCTQLQYIDLTGCDKITAL